MKVVVTGAAGFLGARVADYLLSSSSPLSVSQLLLADVREPSARADPRVRALALDLAAPGACERLVDADTAVVFHLAAAVSGLAEADFDLGLRANLDATRALLEAVRRAAPAARFVFASSVAVFGGELPPVVGDGAAVAPQTSYGTAKAVCELLVNDYSRRGFADGRVVRLPTVSVRAGASNEAVTSFASAAVRDALAGREATWPVPAEQALWLCSPAAAVHNVVHAATLEARALGAWRAVSLPGLRVALRDVLAALRATGAGGPAAAARVHVRVDEFVARVVGSLPAEFAAERALRLGFVADDSFTDIVRAYVRDELSNLSGRAD